MPNSKKNPRKKADTYHHGDLRNALLTCAIEHAQKTGLHNLSLRDLARELGVSHAAPYRHFADKKILLVTLAVDGYERLFASMESAAAAHSEIAAQLEALAWAYVLFCLQNPVHTDILFGSELSDRSQHPHLEAAANRVFELPKDVLKKGQEQNIIVHEPAEMVAATAWSLVHGLAMLLKSNRMRGSITTENQQKKIVITAVQNLLNGIFISAK